MLAAAMPLSAGAQFLDLSGPAAPAPGAGQAAVDLASRLEREADAIAAENAPDPLDASRRDARAALRRAAATLADLGESLGDDGSVALVWAATLDARAGELDAIVAGETDPARLAALAADLADAELDWARGQPVGAAELDERIASALAQLTLSALPEVRSGAGWFAEAEPAAEADALRARAETLAEIGLDESTLDALAARADTIEAGLRWPTYSRRIREEAARLSQAADALIALPDWTPEAARDALFRAFAGAIDQTDAGPTRLVERHAAVLIALSTLDEGREAERLRARAAEAIAAADAGSSRALTAATLAARTIELGAVPRDARSEAGITRVLRPAWRALVPLVRGVSVNARDEAIDLLLDPARATDPGVLATIAAQRRLADDFALIERISRRIDAGLDGPAPTVQAIENRLLAIGQDMDVEATREAALALLREFESQLASFDRIEADRETAARVMGDRGRDLPLRIEGLRDAWRRGWAVPGGNGPDRDTLDDLDALARTVAMLADAEAFTRLETLSAWPGLELSPRARRAIAEGLTGAIDELVPDAMRGGNAVAVQRTAERLVNARGDYAAALLAGRLARTAADAGIALSSPLEELALGPPIENAWMAEHREAIADVCRYAEELARAAAESRGDSETIASLRSLVAWRALRTLEAIERAG